MDPERTVDVYFDRFMQAPMATVEEIYRKAGLTLDGSLRALMAAFLEATPRGKYGQVRHDLRRDFNLTPETIRERFRFYFGRFPVKVEVE